MLLFVLFLYSPLSLLLEGLMECQHTLFKQRGDSSLSCGSFTLSSSVSMHFSNRECAYTFMCFSPALPLSRSPTSGWIAPTRVLFLLLWFWPPRLWYLSLFLCPSLSIPFFLSTWRSWSVPCYMLSLLGLAEIHFSAFPTFVYSVSVIFYLVYAGNYTNFIASDKNGSHIRALDNFWGRSNTVFFSWLMKHSGNEKLTLGGSNVVVSGMRRWIIDMTGYIHLREKIPLDLPEFLHKLSIKFDLIYRQVTTINKYSLHKGTFCSSLARVEAYSHKRG